MTYRVVIMSEAVHQIGKMDAPLRERVRAAIDRLRIEPEIGKRLKGLLTGRWSYRVGDWRLLHKFDRGRLLIMVLTVGHRREVYRR